MKQNIDILDYYLDDFAVDPVRAHPADAGLDLRSPSDYIITSRSSVVIDTGVHINIPKGYAGFLKAKSGLNVKHNIIGTGLIDAGYTGPIVVKLYNLGNEDYVIHAGDKIIQMVLMRVATPALRKVSVFEEVASDRGEGGFGSTGK